MKKGLLAIFMTLLVACGTSTGQSNSDASGSSPFTTPTETDKAQRYDIKLTANNYWKYLDLSITKSDQSVRYSIELDIKGVLTFAYYEDVEMVFEYSIVESGSYEGHHTTFSGDVKVELNAAGCYHASYPYGFVPESIGTTLDTSVLTTYTRTMTFKSIVGTVRFAV